MGFNERSGHILPLGFGYHIRQECFVCKVQRLNLNIKSWGFLTPNLEIIGKVCSFTNFISILIDLAWVFKKKHLPFWRSTSLKEWWNNNKLFKQKHLGPWRCFTLLLCLLRWKIIDWYFSHCWEKSSFCFIANSHGCLNWRVMSEDFQRRSKAKTPGWWFSPRDSGTLGATSFCQITRAVTDTSCCFLTLKQCMSVYESPSAQGSTLLHHIVKFLFALALCIFSD